MSPVAFPIVWAIGLIVFAVIVSSRARLLFAARPAGRLDRIPERLKRAVVLGLGQRKFLSGEQPAGIMHALIFWGFVVLMIQVVTLYGRAFDADWSLPGLGEGELLGPPYAVARDAVEAIVAVGVLYMLYRRLIAHTPRLFGLRRAEQRYRDKPHWEGVLILLFILFIVVGGLLYDHVVGGGVVAAQRTAVLVFLCLLPLTKHFHILTAIPNLFFAKLPPREVARPLAITHVPAAPVAALDGGAGVATLEDLSWKQVLDAFTCTECGRSPRCPRPPPPARARADGSSSSTCATGSTTATGTSR